MQRTDNPKSPSDGRAEAGEKQTTIGPSVSVQGDVTGSENVIIAGHLKGSIKLEGHGLVIEKSGRVEADVSVRDLTLHGELAGNVSASERVLVTESARMTGDITASRISILEGAQFKGSIKIEKTGAS